MGLKPVLAGCTTAAIPAIQIAIPHRTPEFTLTALKRAAELAVGLDACIRLIDIQVVPYGYPLDKPAVDPRHSIRNIRELARQIGAPISAEIVFARDWEQGLRRSLAPGSLVLLAAKRRWWRTSEKRLAGRLIKAGHKVIWIRF